jgi:hypothetical protein
MADSQRQSAAGTASTDAITRLSVPTVRKKARRALSADELNDLRRVANALIPAAGDASAGGDIADFPTQAADALAILDASFDQIEGVLADVHDCPTENLFGWLRELDQGAPEMFYPLSLMITAMYLYSAEVEQLHGYPHPHRNPPSPMQAADEIDSGILNSVMERGSIYVPIP